MANFNLKSIFTSDEKFTVLQLLKAFVDYIDSVEIEATFLHKHTITVPITGGNLILEVVNTSKESLVGTTRGQLDNVFSNALSVKVLVGDFFVPVIGYYDIGSSFLIYITDVDQTKVKYLTITGGVSTDTITNL